MKLFILGIIVAWIIEGLFYVLYWKKRSNKVAASAAPVNLLDTNSDTSTLDKKIAELEDQISTHEKDLASTAEKLTDAEAQVTKLEATLEEKNNELDTLAKEMAEITTAAEGSGDSVTVTAEPLANDHVNDLSVINGIGPKLREALNDIGIQNFNQLVAADIEELMATLKDKGVRFSPNNAKTWSQQATLAAQGDFAGLKDLQAELKA